jgi:hypothetical protein
VCLRYLNAASQPNITPLLTATQRANLIQTNANLQCVIENGPGWSFASASCSCIFTVGTIVGIKFRGCPTFLHLDTDTNFPTDYFPTATINVYIGEDKVVDADLCSNKNGDEYQLRR